MLLFSLLLHLHSLKLVIFRLPSRMLKIVQVPYMKHKQPKLVKKKFGGESGAQIIKGQISAVPINGQMMIIRRIAMSSH